MKKLLVVMAVVAISCLLAVPAFSADKLIVKDATGLITVFNVTDGGQAQVSAEGLINPAVVINGASSSQTVKPAVQFVRARGTLAAPSGVLLGDWLAQFSLNAHNGTAYDGFRRIFQVEATENWAPTAGGYQFTFYTRPNGTVGAPAARVVFMQDGNVQVNNLAGTYVGGSAYVCVNNSGVIFASETPCP